MSTRKTGFKDEVRFDPKTDPLKEGSEPQGGFLESDPQMPGLDPIALAVSPFEMLVPELDVRTLIKGQCFSARKIEGVVDPLRKKED